MTNEQRKALMDSAESYRCATSQAIDDLLAVFNVLLDAEGEAKIEAEFRERFIADVRTRLILACSAHDAAHEAYKAARAIVFFGKA